MASATATSHVLRPRDAAAADDVRHAQHGASGLASLARKLRHPIARIRARALENLLFKLREGLVDVETEPVHAVDECAGALVVCLGEKELEAHAIQVLQLLLGDDQWTRACAPPLRKHGAAAALQRGTVKPVRADLQATYEKLLHRLLATTTAVQEAALNPPPKRLQPQPTSADAVNDTVCGSLVSRVSPSVQVAQASVAARRSRVQARANGTHTDALSSGGWRFPHVSLAAVDEQFLFEFEVKWRLRTTIPEIVDMCDTLRRELLRDFPPEVFLQRPAVILRLLELVQQPIVPAATTPELSFGVNYFDEPASPSFAWKPSVQATALHVSSLKAIESWLASLRHASEVSLNPVYHTFQSSAESSPGYVGINSPGYDHRRLYYPRVEAGENTQREQGEDGFSLSGAAYQLIATLMRLLSRKTSYPRLHLLNVIHAGADFLPERSIPHNGSIGGAHPLDKLRLEALFAILAEVEAAEDADEMTGEDTLVKERALEWLLRALRWCDPSSYIVEGRGQSSSSVGATVVVIPSSLWRWMLLSFASQESKSVNGAIDWLVEIDSSARETLLELRRSCEDSRNVDAVLLDEGTSDEDLRPIPQELALRILQMVPQLSEEKRRNVKREVLRMIYHELETGKEDDGSDRLTQRTMLQTLILATEDSSHQSKELAVSILDQLTDWILTHEAGSSGSDRLSSFVHVVTISGAFMETLLCALAASTGEQTEATHVWWRLAEVLLRWFGDAPPHRDSKRELRVSALSSSVAILQHFAYADASFLSESCENHRRLQRTFVRLVHQLEEGMSRSDQLILVSRCLLHRSAYIRKAAASGLLDQLSRHDLSGESVVSATNNLVVVDPFGQYAGNSPDASQRRVLEDEIPSLLQPRWPNSNESVGEAGTKSTASSLLHRLSRLRKLVVTLSTSDSENASTSPAAASTLQQLLIDVVQATSMDFKVLSEAGEVDELLTLLLGALRRSKNNEVSWIQPARGSLLALVRVILMRSSHWRRRIREDHQALTHLLGFTFDEDARVRAEMYFMVLALTCSVDAVLPTTTKESKDTLEIPSEFIKSFGLLASRWPSSGIRLRALSEIAPELTSAREEIHGILDGSTTENLRTQTREPFQELWESLLAAKSYRAFLDALYRLTQACAGQRGLRAWIGREWESAPLRKYLETPPTSAKDRVIMAGVMGLVAVVFDGLNNDQKMDIIMLLRRFVIPLEIAADGPRSVTTMALSIQLARLLLRISKSEVAGMFASLVIDAGLANKLGGLIVGSSIFTQSAPLQRSLWIDVSIALLSSFKSQHLAGKPLQEQIVEAIASSLRTSAGRHRVPGSFQEREVYVRTVACLAPWDRSEDEDAIHWRSRLVFDCSSSLRSVGFMMAGLTLLDNDKTEDKRRMLRLIVDTMRDEADSDAVRSAAARVLFQFLEGSSADAVSFYASSIDAERLVAHMMRGLVASVNGLSEKCYVRTNLARVQLLRLFVSQHEKFADSPLKTMLDPLLVGATDDFKSTRAIVQLLSVRRVFESYQRHCTVFLKMQSAKDSVWWQSILPAALSTIAETARLLQALMQPPMSAFDQIVSETPLLLQLITTLADVWRSRLDVDQYLGGENNASRGHLEHHFEALDECGKLVGLVITSSPRALSLPVEHTRQLLQTVTSLLSDANSTRFRLSFARVIAAVFSRPSSSLLQEATSPDVAAPLGVSLWTSYRELSELQPAAASSQSPRTFSSYLPQLRRVGFALQLLVSRSPEAGATLCADRYGAVEFIVRVIKSGFIAIRMSGGFGAKSSKAPGNDAFIVDVCSGIQLHCQLLSGFFVNSLRAQDVARRESLCSVFATNWNVMRVAHRRQSSVLLGALRLLQNYSHRNEANKRSIATTVSVTGRNPASDGEISLMDMVGDLALGPVSSAAAPQFDERWSSTAAAILKSSFLHVDCLHGSIKSGLVTKLFASVVDRSKNYRQTVKPLSTQEELTLVELLGVLASVASSDEGRQVLLQQRELKNLFDDVLHFAARSDLMVAGSLFVRNMAFSKFSKSHFVVWEPVIDQILSILASAASDMNHGNVVLSAAHLSTALVCIVFDNQRAQAVMLSSQKTQLRIQEATQVWRQRVDTSDAGSDDRATAAVSNVAADLERVQSLLLSNDVGNERP